MSHDAAPSAALRAKRWLEATGRAHVWWLAGEPVAAPMLTFGWPGGGTFCFDLGGALSGGDLDGQEFLAGVTDRPDDVAARLAHQEYLARCYVALGERPERCRRFLWITWSPVTVPPPDLPTAAGQVATAVAGRGPGPGGPPIDHVRCHEVASRQWTVVLSRPQEEHLVLTPGQQALIRGHVAHPEGQR